MNILIVPDSFKGSLGAPEVCACIRLGIESISSDHKITTLPFADGGEGFADCMANICNGEILYTQCQDIYGQRIRGSIVAIGDTAVIECATASGLQVRKNVMNASSYGTGELIKFAVLRGFHKIILGLGGSGCCDGGAGALTALGAAFYDINYQKIARPTGGDLEEIYGAGFRNLVKDINFTFACDVENTLFGQNGAAYVFAPQKGANKTQVEQLDNGLKRLNAFLPRDVSTVKGGGAAGGICAGLYSLYGGEIISGFEVLSRYSRLEEKIENCDMVITGEGKTDAQTLMGKLPFRVAALAKQYGKPCVIISGTVEEGICLGDRQISLTDENITAEEAIRNAAQILTEKSKFILQ